MLFQFRTTIFWRECLAKDTELRRVVLEGILEDLQSDDAITIGSAQSSLDNYLHVYVREEANRGRMINIGERVTLRSGVWAELKKAAHPAEIGLSEARSFST